MDWRSLALCSHILFLSEFLSIINYISPSNGHHVCNGTRDDMMMDTLLLTEVTNTPAGLGKCSTLETQLGANAPATNVDG
jgi:hypothetical protein